MLRNAVFAQVCIAIYRLPALGLIESDPSFCTPYLRKIAQPFVDGANRGEVIVPIVRPPGRSVEATRPRCARVTASWQYPNE